MFFVKKGLGPNAEALRVYLDCAVNASSYQVDSARKDLPVLLKDPVYVTRAAKIDTLLSWYRKQELRNPMNTYLYATVVPGWGQWYNNDKKGAVAAFGLMAALTGIIGWEGYAFYRGETRQRYVCAMDIFLVANVLWRRYHGTIRKAAYDQSVTINATIQLEYQKRLRSILCMSAEDLPR
jgi:hypothetical protein